MPSATVTSKGQITIPIAVRSALGLRAGDRVQFLRLADGSYAVRPATRPVASIKGFFGTWDAPAVSIEEMEQAVASSVTEANR